MGFDFRKKKCAIVLVVIQVAILILFGVFFRYDATADSRISYNTDQTKEFVNRYGLFQDVHIMIFVGFGFLMTFTSRYSFSALGFNFLLAAIAIQWSIVVQSLIEAGYHGWEHREIGLSIKNLIKGDFAAASVLISFGVLLGKVGPLQLTVMTLIEIVCYSVNVHLCEERLHVADAGGSMLIHSFGAYFGLAVSLVMHFKVFVKGDGGLPKARRKQTTAEALKQPATAVVERDITLRLKTTAFGEVLSTYDHDLFAMIGTIFLWICWPSFNGALLDTYDQQARVAINTYISLVSCVLATFAVSLLLSEENRLEMPLIQNSTLAGGVAIGTMSNFMIYPWGSIIVGFLAGTVSVLGFNYLSRILEKTIGIHDTCGVHNLHGMPGLIGGITGIIGAACASSSAYGYGLPDVFPSRKYIYPSYIPPSAYPTMYYGNLTTTRSAGQQAGVQAATLGITLGISIVGGLLTGLVLRLGVWKEAEEEEAFTDQPFWDVPAETAAEAEQSAHASRTASLANVANLADVSRNGQQQPNDVVGEYEGPI